MTRPASSAPQQIRFCESADGVSIAYALGGHGPAWIKTPNWLNHLELDFTTPVWRPWVDRMTRDRQLVRYDARGCGLSDRAVAAPSAATHLLDLEAVVRATGLSRFVLFGASQGASVAIEYAARHPERVSHLVLYGAYLQGALRRGASAREAEEARTLLKLVELGWGRENSAFRQVFATQFIPDSSLEQLRAFDEIQRSTVTPEMAAALLTAAYEVDVSGWAPRVRCPTLVLHVREDARVPFAQGRRLAAAIAGAEFVPLAGHNHILLDHQEPWHRFFEAIDDFLARHPDPAAPTAAFAALTTGERRVLDLIAAGHNNETIARELGISTKTVRNHINSIFHKLEVDDRAHAIVLARDAGLGR